MDIWAHGEAHGVWKEMTRRVVGGREEVCVSKWVRSLISVMVDMVDMVDIGMVGWGILSSDEGVESRFDPKVMRQSIFKAKENH